MMQDKTVKADDAALSKAAERLRAGALVVFPTETVYGLGADACSDKAVTKIYALKERPEFNPLIAHVRDLEMAKRFALFDSVSQQLARAFWPGPLTLVLPKHTGDNHIADMVTAGLDTVALRAPAHPVAQALLAAFKGPIAAPSANLSGKISPTTAADAAAALQNRADFILDGGACAVGVESTIVKVEAGSVQLLRPGGVAVEAIEAVLQQPVLCPNQQGQIEAPGALQSHYAPEASLRLNVRIPDANEAWLGFGPDPGKLAMLNLSEKGSLEEAAACLFRYLRLLDNEATCIAVAPIPETGLGLAINDRLRRAAAPRPAKTTGS